MFSALDLISGCKVMGVVNVTPDSFSDGGRYFATSDAIAHGEQMIADGAAIVDVGGESTRPGSHGVDVATELERILPVVKALAPHTVLSIDTTKAEVAVAAVNAGATIVNDVGGTLARLAGELGVGYVAMHSVGTPANMQDNPGYEDVVAEVIDHVGALAQEATEAGSPRVWIDPGLGFGKTEAHNLTLVRNIAALAAAGWPVLIGASRKMFIGRLLAQSDGVNSTDTDDRLEGSLTVATWAASVGCDVVRVHDVLATVGATNIVGRAKK
jgi:dihydropteroate synthase